MTTKKEAKKLQKKKKREKEKRIKILKKREELRRPAREAKEEERRNKRIDKLQQSLSEFQSFSTEALSEMDDSKIAQLEENAKILASLESEYEKDLASKRELNENLESEGYLTLSEKLRAMSEKTITEQKRAAMAEGLVDGADSSAEYKIGAPTATHNEPKRGTGAGLGTSGTDEFAEVSLTRENS